MITLSLGFRLYHWYDLGTDLHQFCLGHNSYVTHNILKVLVDQHQVILGEDGAPTLADTTRRIYPNGISLR